MATLSENNYTSDFLKRIWDSEYSCVSATIAQDAAATADMKAGTVLQLETAGYVACTTGSAADAILLDTIPLADLVAGDVVALVLVRGPAIVNEDQLGIAANQLAAAVSALAALNPPIVAIAQGPTSTQST